MSAAHTQRSIIDIAEATDVIFAEGIDDGNVEMTEINSSWVYHGKTIESEVWICREDVTICGPSSFT